MPFHNKLLIPIARFYIPPEYRDHLTLYSKLFSKFSIISIFSITCILKTENLSFVKRSSILKKKKKQTNQSKIKQKNNNQKIHREKKSKTQKDPNSGRPIWPGCWWQSCNGRNYIRIVFSHVTQRTAQCDTKHLVCTSWSISWGWRFGKEY